MLKKFLPVLLLPLLLAGCAARVTNLTPLQQMRNANNLYPVEAAMDSRQQTLRWQSVQPQILVGSEICQMRATPLMSNRWEGLIPVPAGASSVEYRYKIDYQYNRMGAPGHNTVLSKKYLLKITD